MHAAVSILYFCCFLLFFVLGSDVLATNWHFPANFTEVELPDAHMAATGFKLTNTSDGVMIVNVGMW